MGRGQRKVTRSRGAQTGEGDRQGRAFGERHGQPRARSGKRPGAPPAPRAPLPASYQRRAAGRPWAQGGGGGALLQVRWRRRVCGGRSVAGRAAGRVVAAAGTARAGACGRGLGFARRSVTAARPSVLDPRPTSPAPARAPPRSCPNHLT